MFATAQLQLLLALLVSSASAACVPAAPAVTTTKAAPAAPATTTAASGGTGSLRIHPNGNGNWCLEVKDNRRADGTAVQLAACKSSPAQSWSFKKGSGQVKLAGTNYCLDAGSTPGNGVAMKIWTCYSGLAAQTWYYTGDNRIALEGKGQCVDLPNGSLRTQTVQTWGCSNGNNNQVWTTSSASVARRDVEERACSSTSLTPGGRKAGLAGGSMYDELKDYIGWWYDWTGNPSGHTGAPVAVPMLWGNGHRGSLQSDASRLAGFKATWATAVPQYVLGFNEPDCSSWESSDLSVSTAAAAWAQYIAPLGQAGALLVSPAMCSQLDEKFLTPFSAAITTPFDVVAVHIYKPTIAELKAVLDYYWNTYHKPMWVTEFGCVHDQNGFTACYDQGQATQFMTDAVRTFQSDSRVYAYAPCDVGNSWVMKSGGSLTETGRAYLNAVKQYA